MSTQQIDTKSKNILTVELDSTAFREIVPPLVHKLFDVDRFPTTVGALELISVVPFSAIVLNFPLQGMSTDEFLEAVKKPESASKDTKIALLTDPASEPEAQDYLSKGVDMVVSPMSGGSGPIHPFVHELELPVVASGVAYPGSSIHAPNENIRVHDFIQGIRHIAYLVEAYGRMNS